MSVKKFNVSKNYYLDLGNQDVQIATCKYTERLQNLNALEQLQCKLFNFQCHNIKKLPCFSAETEMCDLLISLMKELTPSR